jgi:hypothetical protein
MKTKVFDGSSHVVLPEYQEWFATMNFDIVEVSVSRSEYMYESFVTIIVVYSEQLPCHGGY